MPKTVFCACGKPLHYSDPTLQAMVEQHIADQGPDIGVRVGGRIWLVPRHYIMLHRTVKGVDLSNLKFPEMLPDGSLFYSYLYDNGGAKINMQRPDYRDQVFSHEDSNDGRLRHFHIPKLLALIAQNPQLEKDELPTEDAIRITEKRHIDDTHLSERMTDEMLEQPGIVCVFDDGTWIIADGHHRFLARARRKLEFMQFWFVPEKIWRKSLFMLPSTSI